LNINKKKIVVIWKRPWNFVSLWLAFKRLYWKQKISRSFPNKSSPFFVGFQFIVAIFFCHVVKAKIPPSELNIRNNVEASIFQLGQRYSNSKSRYRGLIKHKIWSNMRCLWVNYVRISRYISGLCQKTTFFITLVDIFQTLGCDIYQMLFRNGVPE
jgi:hypothetical protein